LTGLYQRVILQRPSAPGDIYQHMLRMLKNLFALFLLLFPVVASASQVVNEAATKTLDLTDHGIGIAAIIVFVIAYILVMAEEFTHLRKSKPVIIAAGVIWGMIGYIYTQHDIGASAEAAVRHNFLEYSELMLFLLVAMTYINAMNEREVFGALRAWLIRMGFGFRKLFWMTGTIAFFMSPIADNLTTALLMCAVVMAVGGSNRKFIGLACINIVVAANAGGAFSPFGDITTLMVWQSGVVEFSAFFLLFIPAVVNYIVPASIMHFSVPMSEPDACDESIEMKRGGLIIVALFLLTIFTAVGFYNFLNIPPVIGMLTGLGYLQFFGYYLKETSRRALTTKEGQIGTPVFDIFNRIARAEWDTLLFFYGVVLCVGGLGFIGYLGMASDVMYGQWDTTWANVSVGVLSAIVDNIPVMYAVLSMNPDMSLGQWLLVTLTAGVGGSLLSIGSAAGVALMGQSKGMYTFFGHLKWTPVIALGYAASILTHLWVNSALM